MSRQFRSCSLDQTYLLPPSPRDWLPQNHLAHFIGDLASELDLSAIRDDYGRKDNRGLTAYHPELMVRLLLYAYATGQPSSRKIEQATYTDLAFRYLSANQHPDHDTIAHFRRRHLRALAQLFLQVLRLCHAAGMVKLGNVAIDGTKVKANASRRRSVSYERLCESEKRWQKTVEELLKQAELADQTEAQQPVDELPAQLAYAETRLEAIRFAKSSLAAKAQQDLREAEKAAQLLKRPIGRPLKGKESNELRRIKGAKARKTRQRKRREAQHPTTSHNFVDPDSQLMRDGATGAIVQAYNAQAAVDGEAQVIVACDITDEANDTQQLAPMLRQVEANLAQRPACTTADTGYWDTVGIAELEAAGHWLLIPPERISDQPLPPTATRNSVATTMRERLKTDQGKELYGRRGCIVEPVFGRTKQCRGFRQFALRGKPQVRAEWALICCTHNLLKLFACRAQAKSASPAPRRLPWTPLRPFSRLRTRFPPSPHLFAHHALPPPPSPQLSNSLILRTSKFLLRQTALASLGFPINQRQK